MRKLVWVGVALLSLAIAGGMACGRASSLKGQANATVVFHGSVVDEIGAPLGGAVLLFEVEAFPSDWSFDTRERPHVFSTFQVTSGSDGKFTTTFSGHVLRLKQAEKAGYRHFFDTYPSSRGTIDNTFYMLNSWGDLCYKSDPDHPAVFVFVKDGVKEVSALPCKGGYDSGNGTHWVLNQPGWPRKPSLADVVRKGSAGSGPAGTVTSRPAVDAGPKDVWGEVLGEAGADVER